MICIRTDMFSLCVAFAEGVVRRDTGLLGKVYILENALFPPDHQ